MPSSALAQQEEEGQRAATGQESFTNLIEAVNNSEAQVRALEQQDVQDVKLVNVKDVRSGLDQSQKQQLDQALENANTDQLRSTLNQNDTITSALEESQEDVGVMDVVAINVQEDGTATVFYEPAM